MKKNLIYGIIGGAAVGAAASYLMGATERKNLVSGLKSLGETVGSVGGLLGVSEEIEAGAKAATGAANGGKSGARKSSTTSRRG
jgi:hypothetical protein